MRGAIHGALTGCILNPARDDRTGDLRGPERASASCSALARHLHVEAEGVQSRLILREGYSSTVS
jgi:hypothetical protein